MTIDWFQRFAGLFKENGYAYLPIDAYRSFLSIIDRPGKIIDLGCGNGLLLRYLCDNSPFALLPFGIDQVPEKIQRAKTEIFPERAEAFRVGDIRSCELPDFPFSIIITNPLYADQGYCEQVGGRMVRLWGDGSIGRYVLRCFRHLAPAGLLVLFCYRKQLEEIKDDQEKLDREVGVIRCTTIATRSSTVTFLLAEKDRPTENQEHPIVCR